MRIQLGVVLIVTVLTGSVLFVPAHAQTTSGSFRGTITDQSGAVVPRATIRMTDAAKGVSSETKSNSNGYYEFLNVPPGTYDFAITYSGFETLTSSGVVLVVNQIATLDFSLKPGGVTQNVTVAAQAPLINTTNSTVSTVVESTQVTELPLNGREFTQLILLTPGAANFMTGEQTSWEVTTNLGAVSPAVNGLRPDMNDFTIDGVENNELFFNFVAISPPPDAIQEFAVQTFISNGSFGRAPGANVSIATRSGGNNYHGSAWEFVRNDIFDSRNFFAANRSTFRQNQFGATFGGPIRKDKVWAFGYYEGVRKSLGSVNQGTVPTAAELQGNFSAYPLAIYNPYTTTQTGTDSQGNPIFSRTQFPGNVINTTTTPLNASAVLLAQRFFPAPNLAAAPGQPNFVNTQSATTNWDQWSARVDAALPKNTAFFTRVSSFNATESTPGTLPNTGTAVVNNMVQAMIGLSHTFSPTSVLGFHMQFLRTTPLISQYGSCLPISVQLSSGLANTYDWPGQTGVPVCNPTISLSDFTGLPGQEYIPVGPANNWEIRGDMTKIVGNHTLNFGASVMHSYLFTTNGYANASFDNLPTSDPQNSATTGSGLASFLLGIPSSAYREAGDGGQNLFGNYYGLYINDQWRVTSKLMATLGLRYDYASPLQDTRGRVAAPDWDTSTASNIIWQIDQSATAAATHGISLVANPEPGVTVQRVHPGLFYPVRKDFAPRVALAYRLNSNTSIHSGFGIFYEFNQSLFQSEDDIMGNWPFGNPFFTPSGLNAPTTTTPQPTNILGANVFPPVTFSSVPPIGGGLFAAQPHADNTPYVQEWNAGVDHAFGNNWSLSATYLGDEGVRLTQEVRVNVAPTPGSGAVDPRRRIPQLGTTVVDAHWFTSSYNAFQLKLEKRLSRDLTLLSNYTYSHSLDEGSSSHDGAGNAIQDALDWEASRGNSTFDMTHNFVTSAVYNLPFGVGQRYLTSPGAISKYLVGGWQVSGIVSLDSGMPFLITIPQDNANVGATFQRPTQTGPLLPSGFRQTPNLWFNTTALTVLPYTFGTLGRDVLRGDGFKDFDFSASKRFPITESKNIEFRAEFFNILNHPTFAAPDGNYADSTFGSVLSTTGTPRDIQFALKLNF